jgi:hypothetical protein
MSGIESMCLPYLAMAAMAASSLYSGVSQGAAARGNANQLDAAAGAAVDAAAANEARQRTANRVRMGQRRTATGASGFTTEGSAGDVMEFEAAQAELDALTIRYGGAVQAQNYRTLAKAQRRAATSFEIGGLLGAGGSILAGGARQGWFDGGTGGQFSVGKLFGSSAGGGFKSGAAAP